MFNSWNESFHATVGLNTQMRRIYFPDIDIQRSISQKKTLIQLSPTIAIIGAAFSL